MYIQYKITTNKTLSMKNINIITYDKNFKLNGYCIVYVYKDINFRGTYKNNKPIGYIENHRYNKETTYHII